ncbi:hypothetical protein LEP1GSC005_1362 [Leptospira santarosai str. ST188]|nr:hypothetical protein LEP1GSC005_1362 [Leptospira santarosai str. ST188]
MRGRISFSLFNTLFWVILRMGYIFESENLFGRTYLAS